MKKPKAAPNQAQAEDLSLELKIYSTEHHHKQVRGKLIGKNTAWVVSHGNLVNGSKVCFNFCFFSSKALFSTHDTVFLKAMTCQSLFLFQLPLVKFASVSYTVLP